MFAIGKFITLFLNPLFISMLLLLWSIKSKKRGKKLLLIALIILLVFSNSFLNSLAVRTWENGHNTFTSDATYDAIIVLGGFASKHGESVNFHEAGGRYLEGLRMLHQHPNSYLILSGGSGKVFDQEEKEAVLVKSHAIKMGINPDRILIDTLSKNTHENAVNTGNILTENQLKRPLLITSGFHAYRAKKCFNKQRVYPDILTTSHLVDFKTKASLDTLLIPSSSALKNWQLLFKEWLGIVYYKLSGKL